MTKVIIDNEEVNQRYKYIDLIMRCIVDKQVDKLSLSSVDELPLNWRVSELDKITDNDLATLKRYAKFYKVQIE